MLIYVSGVLALNTHCNDMKILLNRFFFLLWFVISIRYMHWIAFIALIKCLFSMFSHGCAKPSTQRITEEKNVSLESRFFLARPFARNHSSCCFVSFCVCVLFNHSSKMRLAQMNILLRLLKIRSLIAYRAFWQCKTYELIYQNHSQNQIKLTSHTLLFVNKLDEVLWFSIVSFDDWISFFFLWT